MEENQEKQGKPPVKLPETALNAVAMAKMQLENARLRAELAEGRLALMLTQIERDYGFRFNEAYVNAEGYVMSTAPTVRPKPLPPEAEANIANPGK